MPSSLVFADVGGKARFNMRLSDELDARMRAAAAREGVTVAEYVRQCILFRMAWDEGRKEGPSPTPAEVARRMAE